MKKYIAFLLAVLIVGVTLAFAAQYGEITVDPVAVKGKGIRCRGYISDYRANEI